MANTFVMVAVGLLFRYADFVTLLGGTELHLGWIVGVGMVGSLAMRLFLGVAIDHYGPQKVWLWSLVLFSATCFGHLGVDSHHGPAVYLLRIAFCCGTAGIFGASMTFVSGRAPAARMAEMVGMLGTAGFIGMVLGTQVGDLLLGGPTIGRWDVDRMFIIAGTLALCSLLFVWRATGKSAERARRERPSLVGLLRRYHPGTIILVGVAMGAGIGLPGTFLRTYAAEQGIARIGMFFLVYSPTAIVTRVVTRRWPERIGIAPMILVGLGGLAVSQLLLLLVGSEWLLVVPGVGYGIAHAILFPSTIAGGARAFPERHRGLGTTLMLGTFDVGQMIGAPTAGVILHTAGTLGLPNYPTLFASMAATFVGVAAVYGLTARSSAAQPEGTLRRETLDQPRAEPALAEAAEG